MVNYAAAAATLCPSKASSGTLLTNDKVLIASSPRLPHVALQPLSLSQISSDKFSISEYRHQLDDHMGLKGCSYEETYPCL